MEKIKRSNPISFYRNKIIFSLLVLGLIFPLQSKSQNDTLLMPGMANFTTLVLDYTTHAFEGGNLSYYDCPGCTNDSIPFGSAFNPPGDFGDIAFSLMPSSDIIFSATIIWDGTGQITHPLDYNTDNPFNGGDEISPQPEEIVFYNMDGTVTTDPMVTDVLDSLWSVIDTLTITNVYDDYNYNVAIYFYPPSVGSIDYSIAKWIVFFYYNDPSSFIPEEELSPCILFPNPSNAFIHLDCKNFPPGEISYKIYDVDGRMIQQGGLEDNLHHINIAALRSGIYHLQLHNDIGFLGSEKIVKY